MRDKNKRNLEARYLAATIMKLTDNENKKIIEKNFFCFRADNYLQVRVVFRINLIFLIIKKKV